jgi:hypothetical protein
MEVLRAGTVSTNVYLHRFQNHAADMDWLPKRDPCLWSQKLTFTLTPSALGEDLANETNRIRLNVRVRSSVEKLRHTPWPYRLGIVEISLQVF